jgi:tetratricopeptide (TPR) repeat protein
MNGEENRSVMRLPDDQLIPTVLENPEERARLDVISQLFYRAASGSATIADIGEICGLETHLAQRIAAMLAAKGLLSIPGFTPPAPPTPSEEGSLPPPRPSAEPPSPDPELVERLNKYKAILASGNYYELLGVDTDATRAEIRTRYFELSKQLHPDRAFGRDVGEVRHQMELAFQQLTDAYETLSHPARRGEYDARNGIEPKPSRPASFPAPPAPVSTPSRIPRTSSLAPPRTSSLPPRSSRVPRPSVPETDDLHRRWQRERASRALAAALGRPSMAPRPSKAPSTNLEEAKLAIDRERYEDAIRFLMPLLAAMPEDEECLRLMETAKKGLSAIRAKNLISRGLVERRRGNYEIAEDLFSRAISVDSGNLDAKHLIAEMLVERQHNLSRALTLIKEVIAAGGQKARYYSTMGDIMVLNQDLGRAGEAFRRALAVDPENKELRKKLETCER